MTLDPSSSSPGGWVCEKPTALLMLQNGLILEGIGFGAVGHTVGELCFNTAMTGYQEILTDPSYAGQIVTFTFPHIGNVGVNDADEETASPPSLPLARGCVFRAPISSPSNYRSSGRLQDWLVSQKIIGISGVDTRALTVLLREEGALTAVLAHHPDGRFDREALKGELSRWPGLLGMDLAGEVSCLQRYGWADGLFRWEGAAAPLAREGGHHVVAVDYGMKSTILRCLVESGNRVTVVPARATAEEILALEPDGVFLSNGPGDPEATGAYAILEIAKLLDHGIPLFGICLGHQLLGLALGCQTVKMHQGHHGANHPVQDKETGRVMITSMNHGFAVDRESFPPHVMETHVSLFDGSNCGLCVVGKPVFSVQHHPEASPGPQDSFGLFQRFSQLMTAYKAHRA